MSFALLIIFMIVAFALTTLFRRWIDVSCLIAVAIGCAVNANLFNQFSHPIYVGDFIFSIEIVLYTLFMYTIMVRILDYGYKQAKFMTYTSVAAIIISAFIEFMAKIISFGFSVDVLQEFSYYLFSSIGSIVGVFTMTIITIACRKKNISSYIIIPLGIAASSLVHAIFFIGGIALVEWKFDFYSFYDSLGTIIGKAVCILLCIVCYYINQKWWKPLNLVEKKEEIDDN